MSKQKKPQTFKATDFERALIAAFVGQRDSAAAALDNLVVEAKKRLGVPTGMQLSYDVATGVFTEVAASSTASPGQG